MTAKPCAFISSETLAQSVPSIGDGRGPDGLTSWDGMATTVCPSPRGPAADGELPPGFRAPPAARTKKPLICVSADQGLSLKGE
ncbi:hypothetical protein GCM10010231_41050 [Streptomyces sindenensis]|nr:hypothetical protein GCM10010231_41050 [Streptomyces sindenensis]